MKKLDTRLIKRCRRLRMRGYSLGEISYAINLAKSTLYSYVKDIYLRPEQRECIEMRRKERSKSRYNPRKGKCLPGREIMKPKSWSNDLVHIVAHFMFDGRVDEDGCIYYSKDKYQINHMNRLLHKLFKAKPKTKEQNRGVYRLVFYHVELAKYLKKCMHEIFAYLNNGVSQAEKKIFLRAFFDDEGNVFFKDDKRRIRGYQKSAYLLDFVRKLLGDFGISAIVNKDKTNIEITGYGNLRRFSQEINFSSQIYINPQRKNSIWKKKISKRSILDLLLKAYRNKP